MNHQNSNDSTENADGYNAPNAHIKAHGYNTSDSHQPLYTESTGEPLSNQPGIHTTGTTADNMQTTGRIPYVSTFLDCLLTLDWTNSKEMAPQQDINAWFTKLVMGKIS